MKKGVAEDFQHSAQSNTSCFVSDVSKDLLLPTLLARARVALRDDRSDSIRISCTHTRHKVGNDEGILIGGELQYYYL